MTSTCVCTAYVIQQALAARLISFAVASLLLTCRYITDARGLVIGLLGVMHNMQMSASFTAFTAVEAYVLPSHLVQVSHLTQCAVRQDTPAAWHLPVQHLLLQPQSSGMPSVVL